MIVVVVVVPFPDYVFVTIDFLWGEPATLVLRMGEPIAFRIGDLPRRLTLLLSLISSSFSVGNSILLVMRIFFLLALREPKDWRSSISKSSSPFYLN